MAMDSFILVFSRSIPSLSSFSSGSIFSVLFFGLFKKVFTMQKVTSRLDKDIETCLRIVRTYWHPGKKVHIEFMCSGKQDPWGQRLRAEKAE